MNSTDVTSIIINTLNSIFESLFSSIDNTLYEILDNLVFINPNILNDTYFLKIFGTSSTNGMLLLSNSLLVGMLIYYASKYLFSNFSFSKIESPWQFIFKFIIFAIFMNGSFFIIEQILNLNNYLSEIIRSFGEDLFEKQICFKTLISEINNNLSIVENVDIFTIDGLIKGTLTISLLNLLFSYSMRYVLIKVFILLSPFAFLSLTMDSTSHFFKSWYKSLFSLLFIQILVSIVLVLLFAIDYSKDNIFNKFIYLGGIYVLIKSNSIVNELFGGISTTIQNSISSLKLFNK